MQLLDFNNGINFGSGGNLHEFSPVGFSPIPDQVSTWSEAPVAHLTFRLPPLRHDVRVAIQVFPFLVDQRIARQDCWIYFNGLFVHYQYVTAPADIVFMIPRELLVPRANRLSFALPNAAAPSDLGLGNDVRKLGLSFVTLSAGPP